jgi:hypothetical protein
MRISTAQSLAIVPSPSRLFGPPAFDLVLDPTDYDCVTEAFEESLKDKTSAEYNAVVQAIYRRSELLLDVCSYLTIIKHIDSVGETRRLDPQEVADLESIITATQGSIIERMARAVLDTDGLGIEASK